MNKRISPSDTYTARTMIVEQADASGQRPRLDSADLLGGAREVLIMHAGAEYRLRVTSQGKLILTK